MRGGTLIRIIRSVAMLIIAVGAAMAATTDGLAGPARADRGPSCFAPEWKQNFGIPIAATPSLWLNPSCAGTEYGRRCSWPRSTTSGGAVPCINYPPVPGFSTDNGSGSSGAS